MPTVYHGTNRPFATAMATTPGTIRVGQGGGEFGRGFYCGDSIHYAWAFAINRWRASPAVLELVIDDARYNPLNIKTLSVGQARSLTRRIRSRGQQHLYLRGCDVLVGPIESNPQRIQRKFESENSEALLNGPQTARRVL